MDETQRLKKFKDLIQDQGKSAFVEGHEDAEEEALGVLIAHFFKWDGGAILETLCHALEDANFHTLESQIRKLFTEGEKEVEEVIEKVGAKA